MNSPTFLGIEHRILKRAALLFLGYCVVIIAGAFFYAFLLNAYDLTRLSKDPFAGFVQYFLFAVIYGSFLGLPYTIIGSIIVRFVLPQKMFIFLFVGMFCPASALLLLFGESIDNEGRHMLVLSFPPGLLSAYLYGAIGFGYGFKRWKL